MAVDARAILRVTETIPRVSLSRMIRPITLFSAG
jgi:hypothetical protein